MAEPLDEIRAMGLRFLARREYSWRELKQRLEARGFAAKDVGAVVDELAAKGWQSDTRFALSYARARIQKGYGPLRIQYELRERGVDNARVDAVVGEVCGDWAALIERTHRKRYRETTPETVQERAKRARYLRYRGFTQDQIQALFAGMKQPH